MNVLPHWPSRHRINLKARPVLRYALVGVGVALTFQLFMACIGLLLLAEGKRQGDMSGVWAVIGFMVAPLIILAGVPWSIVGLDVLQGDLQFIPLIAGPLVNGAIIGAAYGYQGRKVNSDGGGL